MSEHAEAVEKFRNGPAILEEVLRGMPDRQTTFVPAPGKWNIRQILRHLADTEIVVGMRLRQIAAEDKPTLIPFNQDAWAVNLAYEHADALDSFNRFRSLREDTARVISALPAEAFARTGVHPERGEKTLLEWVRLFGNHVETHAKQIRDLRDAERRKSEAEPQHGS